jgi:predicted transcriptional regulator
MMHTLSMRTSINLDDDVHQIATLYAAGRGITLSAAINEVVRKVTTPSRSRSHSSLIETAPNGMPVFASRGRVITPEMVKAAQEDKID